MEAAGREVGETAGQIKYTPNHCDLKRTPWADILFVMANPSGAPALRLEAASKSYPRAGGNPLVALRSASLILEPGTTTAVVGRSGSGKTTLLHLAAGIDVPDQGRVEVLGRDLGRMRDRERALFRRDHVGMVFQFFRLLDHMTVEENVTLPARIAGDLRRHRRRAGELLDRVGLASRAGDRVDGLSGGEQQRVAICRALLRGPSLLLADEPTGNLDDDSGAVVMDLLLDMAREDGKTLLYVTHSAGAAALAGRRLKLASGVLQAPPADG